MRTSACGERGERCDEGDCCCWDCPLAAGHCLCLCLRHVSHVCAREGQWCWQWQWQGLCSLARTLPPQEAALRLVSSCSRSGPCHTSLSSGHFQDKTKSVVSGGKGTLCEQLSKLGHIHISAGSLLRSHIKEGLRGSVNHILNKQEWLAVKDSIEKGRLICSDIMVRLLRHEMAKYEQCSSSDSASMTGRLILLDGFPRNWENHDAWHKFIMMNNESKCSCEVAGYLLLDCSSDVMIERCLSRAKRCAELGGEPRSDDRIDVIKRRVESFHRDLGKVTDHYGSPSVSKVKAGETY